MTDSTLLIKWLKHNMDLSQQEEPISLEILCRKDTMHFNRLYPTGVLMSVFTEYKAIPGTKIMLHSSSKIMFLLLITSRIAIRLFSFNKILLFIKKLAFDGFYPLLRCFKKSIFELTEDN